MSYQHFLVNIEQHVARVSFNRPEKANALDRTSWDEFKQVFEEMDGNPDVRAVILSGEGKHFCGGIDLSLLMDLQSYQQIDCDGRMREALRAFLIGLQTAVNAVEKCRKPVLAAVHSACLGAGLDIAAACDMRYCTDDAYFSIKEIDLGLVADLGVLQRLPKAVSPGFVAEMAFTGRNVSSAEAGKVGLVNHVFESKDEMMTGVTEIAQLIASKSPLSVRGTKDVLLYARDHSVPDALNYMVAWNAGMFFSSDLLESFQASMEKRQPEFED